MQMSGVGFVFRAAATFLFVQRHLHGYTFHNIAC